MDEQNYNEKFQALTEGMVIEKMYDTLANRAEFVRVLAMHCGEIYKAAREAGLPRRVAGAMAREYFQFETTPSGVYMISGGDE